MNWRHPGTIAASDIAEMIRGIDDKKHSTALLLLCDGSVEWCFAPTGVWITEYIRGRTDIVVRFESSVPGYGWVGREAAASRKWCENWVQLIEQARIWFAHCETWPPRGFHID